MKKYYREFGYIGGVCETLGKNLNIDPFFIRMLFCAGLCYGGITLWIYILLWILTPEKKYDEEDF